MPEYNFHYFGFYTRGEACRMMLNHAGADWTDNRIQMDQWGALKATMPNGQVPALEWDGKMLGQSMSILRFLGAKHGYYPTDAYEAYQVDSLLDSYSDVIGKIYMPHFKPEAERPALLEDLKTQLTKFLTSIDAQCAKGQFLCGEKLTCADFAIGGIWTNFINNEHVSFGHELWAHLKETFPNFVAYGERFAAANAKHLEARPAAPI